MKVVQILPELNAGGVERGTLEVAAHLVRQGHQSIVISNGGRLVPALEASGARHVGMPVHRKSLATLLQVRALRQFLTIERPDILHIRSRAPGWVAWLAWRGMPAATRPRLVSTVHGFYSVNIYSTIMTRGEMIIAVSESIREYILKNYPETPAEKIHVIPRGIKLCDYGADFQPSEQWLACWKSKHPSLADKCVLLLPGRITRLKGHEDFFNLIFALKQRGTQVHGLVAGDTHPKKLAYLDELHGLIRSLDLADDITFLGHRTDIREIMAVCDLICALSQQPESFGRTVLEAMALGKPVAGYDCGGVGGLLEHLFPEGRIPLGEPNALLEAAHSIIRRRPSPKVVGEPYTLETMCSSTQDLYQKLVSSPR